MQMPIHYTGHHLDVTPALQAFTEEKLNKLKHHFDKITSIHVTFNVQKLEHVAEATVHVAKGELHAHSASEDMYTSVDALIDKLDVQLEKYKAKHMDHRQ